MGGLLLGPLQASLHSGPWSQRHEGQEVQREALAWALQGQHSECLAQVSPPPAGA